MSDLFISYSRKDKDFVQKLHAALKNQGRDIWVDWEDIPLTADWRAEMYIGIEQTDNFLFIISPDSVSSKPCEQEIEHALKLNKRLVPVMYRKTPSSTVHPALRSLNFIPFLETDDFEVSFTTLAKALDTDLEYIKTHTRLLIKALEWEKKNRDRSFLLRGTDLKEADQWFKKWVTQSERKEPEPTKLQTEYITKSLQAQSIYQRRTLQGVSLALVMTVFLGIVAWQQFLKAKHLLEAQIAALSQYSEALTAANQPFDGLLQGLVAAQLKKELGAVKPDIQNLVIDALEHAVYRVREQNRLLGHQDAVNTVEFSPDGKIIATGSWDTTVKLWNRKGELLSTLRDHQDGVNAIAFLPNSQLIATSSYDGTVKLWKLDGTLVKAIKFNERFVSDVTFSPTEKMMAMTSYGGRVKLVNLDGKVVRTLRPHQEQITQITFSPDGKIIATGSADKTIKLWNLQGVLLQTLRGHSGTVNSLAFSPDSQMIVSGSADQTVKIWKTDGTLLKTLIGHKEKVNSVQFSSDGENIISLSREAVKIWSKEGLYLDTITDNNSIYSASFSPDNQMIATGRDDNTVKLFHRQWSYFKIFQSEEGVIKNVHFSANDQTIATVMEDGTARFWSPDGRLLYSFQDEGKTGDSLLSPDGNHLIVIKSNGTVKLISRDSDEPKILQGHEGWVLSTAFSPDSQLIATASADKTVKLWNTQGEEIQTLGGYQDGVKTVLFSLDGATIATASYDHQVKLWSREGTELKTLTLPESDEIVKLHFRRDGQLLIATLSDDKNLKLWNIEGKTLLTLPQDERIWSVLFSAESDRMATLSFKGTAKLWNIEGKLLQVLEHERAINELIFSLDSQMIATASADKTVKIWSRDGQLLRTLPHDRAVYLVAFSSDSKTFMSVNNLNSLMLWNLDLSKLQNLANRNLYLEELMKQACDWTRDYRTYQGQERDRMACNDI